MEVNKKREGLLRPVLGLLFASFALPITGALGQLLPIPLAFALGGGLAGALFGIAQVWGQKEKFLPMLRFVGLSAALSFFLSLFIPGI